MAEEKVMSTRTMIVAALAGTALAVGMATNAEKRPVWPEKPAWQGDLDWATANETGPDDLGCPKYYTETAPECLSGGGRACLMRFATQAAQAHDDDAAFRLALITECHDPAGVQSLAEAGHELVGEYLRTK